MKRYVIEYCERKQINTYHYTIRHKRKKFFAKTRKIAMNKFFKHNRSMVIAVFCCYPI